MFWKGKIRVWAIKQAQLKSLTENQIIEIKDLKTDELITRCKQGREIGNKQQMIGELNIKTINMEQWIQDLKDQLEMTQEEEIFADVEDFR